MFAARYFGKVYMGGRYFGPVDAGGGDPPEPPASDDYSYPVTEYLSKRPPAARVRE